LAIGLLLAAGAAYAQNGPAPPFQSYAAKFVCGPLRTDLDVVRGIYATDINIHNPAGQAPVKFFKKAVDAASGTASTPFVFVSDALAADHVELITCVDIYRLLGTAATPGSHVEGFVVIEVPPISTFAGTQIFLPLDVVGKYTARQFTGDVQSLSIVPYEPKLITQ
jgi:hypothetical protein